MSDSSTGPATELDLHAVDLSDDGLFLEHVPEAVSLGTFGTTSTASTASCPSSAMCAMTASSAG